MMEKTTVPFLPHELIIEILLKLQVKSLIRFKCVCKSWYSLISDSNFGKSHFQLTTTTHTPRILSISDSSLQIRSVDFESSSLNNDVNLIFQIPQSNFRFEIKGSCRGFIFLYCYTNICLWNPTTGFRKQISLSPFDSKLEAYYSGHIYGFGYDESRDDYLVVVLSYDPWSFSSHLEYFSFRDNTWKQIQGARFPYMNAFSKHKLGFLFNGAIHWLAYRYDLSVSVILAFDLVEKKLLEMHLPDYYHDYDATPEDSVLWVFGGFLSLCEYWDGELEIWVMKEYTVHSSWTKTRVILNDHVPIFTPIYSSKNGDMIGTNGGNALVKYNSEGQLLGHHSYCDDPDGSLVAMYTESLLSLPGDAGQV